MLNWIQQQHPDPVVHGLRIGKKAQYSIVGITALLVAIAKLHFSNPVIPDDAFITLRYSYNLLHHGVFAYNYPGLKTSDAATSPFYAILLTPFLALFGAVRAIDVVMVTSIAGSAVLLFKILEDEWSKWAAIAGTLALILNDYLYTTRGMETSLFIFLCLLTIHLFTALIANITSDDNHPKKYLAILTGAIWSLSVFTRGEAILIGLYPVALVISIWLTRNKQYRPNRTNPQDQSKTGITQESKYNRTFPNRKAAVTVLMAFIVGCLIVCLPLLAWLYQESGQLIPLTLKAKEDQAKSGFWGKGWIYYKGISQFIKLYAWPKPIYIKEMYAIGLETLLGLAYFISQKRKLITHSQSSAILAFGILQLLAYGNLFVVPFYNWYVGPQLITASLLIGIVVAWALTNIARKKVTVIPAALAITLFLFFAATSATFGYSGREITNQRQVSYTPTYVAAGTWLKHNTPRNATIAATEIGYLGYYSQRHMVDYLGLLSPKTAKWTEQGNFFNWIFYYQPDYWVVHNPTWSFEEAATLPWFHTSYALVATFPGLRIYKRIRPVPNINKSKPFFRSLSAVPGTPKN